MPTGKKISLPKDKIDHTLTKATQAAMLLLDYASEIGYQLRMMFGAPAGFSSLVCGRKGCGCSRQQVTPLALAFIDGYVLNWSFP